jgi:hypothetical protein
MGRRLPQIRLARSALFAAASSVARIIFYSFDRICLSPTKFFDLTIRFPTRYPYASIPADAGFEISPVS